MTQLSHGAGFGAAFDQASPVDTDRVVTAWTFWCTLAGKRLQHRERRAGHQVLVGLKMVWGRGREVTHHSSKLES